VSAAGGGTGSTTLDEPELRLCCEGFLRHCGEVGWRVWQDPRQVEAMLSNMRMHGHVRWRADGPHWRDELPQLRVRWNVWLAAWTAGRQNAQEPRPHDDEPVPG